MDLQRVPFPEEWSGRIFHLTCATAHLTRVAITVANLGSVTTRVAITAVNLDAVATTVAITATNLRHVTTKVAITATNPSSIMAGMPTTVIDESSVTTRLATTAAILSGVMTQAAITAANSGRHYGRRGYSGRRCSRQRYNQDMSQKTRQQRDETPGLGVPLAAPGDLAMIQDFVNTRPERTEIDDFATPDDLASWLTKRGLLSARTQLSEEEWRRTLTLREAFHAQFRANTGGFVAAAHEIRALEQISHQARFQIRYDNGPSGFESLGEGLDRAFGTLLLIVIEARSTGRWKFLKVCQAEGCERIYFDRAPGGVGKWCTKRCGNTMRGRTHRKTEYYKSKPKPLLRVR